MEWAIIACGFITVIVVAIGYVCFCLSGIISRLEERGEWYAKENHEA